MASLPCPTLRRRYTRKLQKWRASQLVGLKKRDFTMSKKSISAAQIKQILGFVGDVLKSLKVSFEAVQAFISSSRKVDRFKDGIKNLVQEVVSLNPYWDEKEKNAWNKAFYPLEYGAVGNVRGPGRNWVTEVPDQILKLTKAFGGINLSEVDEQAEVVEEYYRSVRDYCRAVLPKISFLGKFFGVDDPYGEGYPTICVELLKLLLPNISSPSVPYWVEAKGENSVVATQAEVLRGLEAKTRGDVLVFPVNMGSKYAGWSGRAVIWEISHQERPELLLGLAHVTILLWMMPKRISSPRHLAIECLGDLREFKYSQRREGGGGDRETVHHEHCPVFRGRDPYTQETSKEECGPRLKLDEVCIRETDGRIGPAVAFLPSDS